MSRTAEPALDPHAGVHIHSVKPILGSNKQIVSFIDNVG